MEIKPGHYAIKLQGKVIPARWDGENWHHEYGTEPAEQVIHPIALACQTGCVCTTNPDGTVNVNCNPKQ